MIHSFNSSKNVQTPPLNSKTGFECSHATIANGHEYFNGVLKDSCETIRGFYKPHGTTICSWNFVQWMLHFYTEL